jgi:hypothetical protein
MRLRPRKRAGRCYELAYRYLMMDERFSERSSDTDWLLVHGEVNGPDGTRIGHAWLEREGEIYDPVGDEFLPKVQYRMRFAVKNIRKYSRLEVAEAVLACNHLGPWVETG